MGRLFWKFFFFVWLAQLATTVAVTGFFWWKHEQREMQWRSAESAGPEQNRPPPPWRDGKRPSPRPPRGHLPIEPLLFGFLASLVSAALLARHFSRPIRTLRSAFDSAAAGQLDVRVGEKMGWRQDELADLGRDFDFMANRLQTVIDGQRRLLHDVSHELRSPLARLQAAVDLARQQPARREDLIGRVEKESVRMDRLVGELLTLSRLETGTAGRRVEEIDLLELISGIVTDAHFEAKAREVAVSFDGNCDGIVDGDSELLHRAIENVVRNAIRFSPRGETVGVATRMRPDAGAISITVQDAGPGVPESELEAIFQPFHRGSQPADYEGYGLGLAIAKRVVESLGGRISGANRAEGGFSMEIVLPVRMV